MTLFHLTETPQGITLTEKLPNGGKFRCNFNTLDLAQRYMEARRDTIEYGREGALKKWNREEAKERRKLGLPVKADYSVTHYGDAKKAACGVERGVEGNIRQRVVDHTWFRGKVTCPDCLEEMEHGNQ